MHANVFKAVLEARYLQRELEAQSAKELSVQLEIERELRSRCEIREENERRERTAASAQFMAIQSECKSRFCEMEEKMRTSVAQ